MLRGACAQLRRNAHGLAARGDPSRRRRGLATRTAAALRPRHRGLSTKKERDPAVAHATQAATHALCARAGLTPPTSPPE